MAHLRKGRVKSIIYLIAFAEVAIGLGTISGLVFSVLFSLSGKPPNVFMFVLVSALISASLGLGILFLKEWARKLLMFFSGWVILTKILVFINILQFSGELITAVSNPIKNTISILYHIIVVVLLHQHMFKEQFS